MRPEVLPSARAECNLTCDPQDIENKHFSRRAFVLAFHMKSLWPLLLARLGGVTLLIV